MATRSTNEAVDVYRKLKRYELDAARTERELHNRVIGLDEAETAEYLRMTEEIEDRLAKVEEVAEDWSESTRKMAERKAIMNAGLDR